MSWALVEIRLNMINFSLYSTQVYITLKNFVQQEQNLPYSNRQAKGIWIAAFRSLRFATKDRSGMSLKSRVMDTGVLEERRPKTLKPKPLTDMF